MLVPTRSARSHTSKRMFALAAVAAIALAACGDDDDDDAAPAAAPTTESAASPTTAAAEAPTTTANDRGLYGSDSEGTATTAAAAAGGGEGVVLVADSDLGQILTASDGMTLYMFMPDAQGDPTCTADCAKAWPPLTVEDGAAVSGGDGVDASLLGTATHPESGTQVTYNGWPLYYYTPDAAPGDTTGQGQGGVWYVLDPAGNPISDS